MTIDFELYSRFLATFENSIRVEDSVASIDDETALKLCCFELNDELFARTLGLTNYCPNDKNVLLTLISIGDQTAKFVVESHLKQFLSTLHSDNTEEQYRLSEELVAVMLLPDFDAKLYCEFFLTIPFSGIILSNLNEELKKEMVLNFIKRTISLENFISENINNHLIDRITEIFEFFGYDFACRILNYLIAELSNNPEARDLLMALKDNSTNIENHCAENESFRHLANGWLPYYIDNGVPEGNILFALAVVQIFVLNIIREFFRMIANIFVHNPQAVIIENAVLNDHVDLNIHVMADHDTR
jgi:hypothetical protein